MIYSRANRPWVVRGRCIGFNNLFALERGRTPRFRRLGGHLRRSLHVRTAALRATLGFPYRRGSRRITSSLCLGAWSKNQGAARLLPIYRLQYPARRSARQQSRISRGVGSLLKNPGPFLIGNRNFTFQSNQTQGLQAREVSRNGFRSRTTRIFLGTAVLWADQGRVSEWPHAVSLRCFV